MEMKLCKNCKWIEKRWFILFKYCYHPEIIKDNYLKFGSDKAFADDARVNGPCYIDGKYFEGKIVKI